MKDSLIRPAKIATAPSARKVRVMRHPQRRQLEAVCAHLALRRPAILRAWRKAAEADPTQSAARALTRGQFNDHIPEVLDAFEQKLRTRPGGTAAAGAGREQKSEEVKHGLHRWQQGYRLRELMNEWGHLRRCLFEELETYAAAHPEFTRVALAEVNRRMIMLVNEAISESAGQYERLQQAEAASHMGGLRKALARVNDIERGRAALIHQAVHDLRSDVFGVRLAANLLRDAERAPQRGEFARLLEDGVKSVSAMLGELMELARLEAGQEHRVVGAFDGATLARELCARHQPAAAAAGLRLTARGPRRLAVAGDAGKVRRLLQNLVGNALKYTGHGRVSVSWGATRENWWLKVSDTGPGLSAGAGTPLARGLKAATASARESDVKTAARTGGRSQVLTPPRRKRTTATAAPEQAGEGIGLSIVKRLCELLGASLEVASSAATGTVFRVVLPRRYAARRATGKRPRS